MSVFERNAVHEKRVVVVSFSLVHLRRLGRLRELEPAVARAVRVRVRLETNTALHVHRAPHERVTGKRAEGAAHFHAGRNVSHARRRARRRARLKMTDPPTNGEPVETRASFMPSDDG